MAALATPLPHHLLGGHPGGWHQQHTSEYSRPQCSNPERSLRTSPPRHQLSMAPLHILFTGPNKLARQPQEGWQAPCLAGGVGSGRRVPDHGDGHTLAKSGLHAAGMSQTGARVLFSGCKRHLRGRHQCTDSSQTPKTSPDVCIMAPTRLMTAREPSSCRQRMAWWREEEMRTLGTKQEIQSHCVQHTPHLAR